MKYNVIFYVFTLLLLFSCKENRKLSSENPEANVAKQDKNNYSIPSNLKILNQEEINFDNAPDKEMIITATDSAEDNIYEFWFKSNKLIYKFSYPWTSINKKWLVNINDDDKKAIIRAQGYEDGIDYVVYNIVNNQQKPILYFNPVLQDSRYPGAYLWAYPNDISELVINQQKEIQVSLYNNYQRDDDHIVPDNQKELPFIFFEGRSSQPDMRISKMNKPQFMTIETIINSVRKGTGLSVAEKSAQSSQEWSGTYTGRFLRMKEESGDPRGWGQILLKVDENTTKFQLDSYVENIKKDLTIINESSDEIVFAEKNNKNSIFTLTKKKNKYELKSNFINQVVGETNSYELGKN
jgi:hypothetical protein